MAAIIAAIFCFYSYPEDAMTELFSDDDSSNDEFTFSDESSGGTDSLSDNAYSELSSDFDDLFSNAEDTENAVVTESEGSGTDTTFSLASLAIPLTMSGDLSAELGAAYINTDGSSSGTGYFDLVNYLYFTTRPDKYMAVKGSLKTSLIDSDEADTENQNKYFYLYELYFDYIMMDRVYITAGKKKTVWGNIRLFSNDDDFEDDDDALYTNALYDSRYNISGIIRVPFGPSTITLLTMYRGGNDEPSHRDLSYAASLEAVIFGTSLNFFARTFPSRYGNLKKYYNLPILGFEFKRTIFGVDIYAQGTGRVISNKTLREFWKRDLYKKSAFEKMIFTGGFYKIFSNSFPYFGINAEFQSLYYPNDVILYSDGVTTSRYEDDLAGSSISSSVAHEGGTFENRFVVDAGFSKLGKDRNMKVGIQWYHNITQKSGYVKPAFIVSRIIPHCDWQLGLKWEYWDEQKYFGKITLGTYLKFFLSY